MKKLMTMIAALACAVGVYAENPKDTFESYDLGALTNSAAWSVSEGSVTNEANVVEGAAAAGSRFLSIDESSATTPVKRFFNARTYDSLQEVWNETSQTIPATGLYFDSQVKFTIADTLTPTGYDADLAKIAVFAYCDDENPSNGTNLIVRAGYYDGDDLVATNYTLNATIDPEAWYRLTVKTIPTGKSNCGFVIYIDEKPVAYKEEGIGDVTGLNAIATKYNEAKQLLPSLIKSGSTKDNLTQVSFVGSGKVDDVDFTATVPGFAQDALTITIAWDAGVDTITTNGAAFVKTGDTGSVDVNLPPETETFSIAATMKTGFAPDGWEDQIDVPVETGDKFDIKSYEYAFTVDGVPYKTLSAAVEAAAAKGGTLKLCKGLEEAIEFYEGTVILDLAGKDMAEVSGAETTVYVGGTGTLIITNSTPAVGTIYPSGGVALYNEGTAYVYGGKLAGSVVEDAIFFGGSVIGEAGDFPYSIGDEENYEAVYDEGTGYWTVQKKGGPIPPEPPVVKPFVIIIGSTTNGYDTLEQAIAAFTGAEGEKIAFMEAYSRTDDLTIDNGLVLDINGQTVVMSNIAVTAGTTKLINSKSTAPALTGSTGLFVPNGEISVSDDATIDLSALPFGETYGGVNGPGSLTLAAGATAKFYKWNVAMVDSANWMFYNYPAFFTGSVIPVDGIVMIGDKAWTGAADRFVIDDEVATAVVAAYHNVGGDMSAFTHIESFTSVDDAINATTDNKVTVTDSASASAQKADLEITINSGATLTITAPSVAENVTFKGEGSLARSGALDVAASLDLASLAYTQTAGCTGGFNIKDGGIVYMPIGVTYPNATLAVNTESTVDGAKIVVGGASGTTYTYGGGAWIEGEDQPVAKIGTVGYASLQAALSAAQASETVTLLANVSLDATLVVDKAITLDLGTKTVTMAPTADMGVNVKAAATIKNGKFVSSRTTDGGYAIVTDPAIAATYEDLEIDGAHYRFVFTCDSEASDIQAEFDAKPTVKVTCKNVDVKGNGTLFYAQHTLLDLDAYCSATVEGTPSTAEPYHAALYSALNATITVAGGTYANTNALVVGNLGGKIVIEDGTLTGNIKSYMYKDDDRFTNNVATVEIKGGTIKGGFTFADDQAGACTKEEVKWNVTGGSFSSDPSSYVAKGYKAIFNGMTTTWAVVKAYEVKDVTTKGGSLSFDPSEAAEGETVTVTPSASSGYTFQPGSITSTDVTISGDTFVMPAKDVEVSATFTANIYNVTAATGLTGGTVGVDRNTATVEDTVNVTAEPDTANGYKLVAVKVNGNAIQGTSFQMWAQDVTVSAEFSNMYTLTVPTVANATAVVSNGAEQATAPYTFAYNTEVKVYWTAAEGYQITAGAVETITMSGDKTAAEPTVAEAPSKPMSDEAETSEVDPSTGICVVTPKDSSTTEVTIKNGDQFGGARFEIPSTVKTIKGVDNTQVLVKNGDIVIPDGALTFSGDATAGVTYDLNPEGVVNEVPVQPTIGSGVESTEVKPADGAVAVKAIAGLYYSLVRGDDPATVQTAGTVTDSAQAETTGETVELTDETEKGSKGFYIIKVTIDNPEE